MKEMLSQGTIVTSRGQAVIGWGKRYWQSEPIPGALNFYFPDFFLSSSTPWFTHEQSAVIPLGEFLRQLPSDSGTCASFDWETSHELIFMQEMQALKQLFHQGTLQKAVPYAFLESKRALSAEHLLRSLRAGLETVTNSHGYLYGFWDSSEGILGVTPEILFEGSRTSKGSTVHTMAVAGTSGKAVPSDALLNDIKTRHEHQLVVQGIIESLSPYGKVLTEPCRLLPLRHLAHLATPIELMAAHPVSFDRLVDGLHPTPALGAYPKEAGSSWLRSYEDKVPRGRYGAPVGVLLSPDEFICLVAIRNVQWTAKAARIGAGCGVIAQSKDIEEWQEIELKWNAIRQTLTL